MKHFIAILLILLMIVPVGRGQEAPAVKIPDKKTDKVDSSVKSAVAFLVSQQKADGSITDTQYSTTMTSLAILAICASGHMPDDKTAEGIALHKAIEFVLRDDRQDETGYFGSADGSRMYGHGITTPRDAGEERRTGH